MQLRPYQKEDIATIESHGAGKYLCQLATGLGKTVTFASLPRQGRSLILAHREELITQPVKYYNCPVGIEMAESVSNGEEVVCASVQSLVRRVDKFTPDTFDTIIVDECHHASGGTYQKILNHFKPRRVLGFTATPNRADGVGLEVVFDKIIIKRDLKWGIEQGYLSRIIAKRINIGYDLTGVHSKMGDYAINELERAVNVDGANEAIAEAVKNIAEMPVLIFAVDVKHAEAIAKKIPGAIALSANSKNRSEVVSAYKKGEIPVLVNCALFTEGTDLPNTRTILIARPTKSISLYTQMVGRGTRLSEGKTECLLIDCVGSTNLPLCTAPSLLGLDLDGVAKKYQMAIEGDLLNDIPERIESVSDRPESWINNVRIVNLWAKAQGYNLFDVNWIKLPNGTLRLRIPVEPRKYAAIQITAPDLMGNVTFSTSGGGEYELPAQDAYELAYDTLRTRFKQQHPLWSLKSAKRWGNQPANDKQNIYIQRLAKSKRIDVSNVIHDLTKLQAAQLIERMKG